MVDLNPLIVAWIAAHAVVLAYVVALNVWSRVTGQ